MSKHIFIIEHNQKFSDLLVLKLTVEGDVVTVCHTAKEALEQIASVKPDFIVLNENMPKMSGKEILEKLSHDPLTRDIPKLFITNASNTSELQKLYEYGVRQVFPRTGYDEENVADAIRRAIKFPEAFALKKQP